MANLIYTQSEVLNRAYIENANALRIQGAISVGGTRTKVQSSQNLADAPFEYLTNITTSDFYLRGVTIRVTDGSGNSVDIMEKIEIVMDEGNDNFDTPIIAEDFIDDNGNGTNAFAFFPDSNILIFGTTGTQLKLKVSNYQNVGVINATVYLEVL